MNMSRALFWAFFYNCIGIPIAAGALIPAFNIALNPMLGACGISAFPMASRVVQKIALEDDDQNFILMHAVSANVSGQIGSVIIGGIILSVIPLLAG